MEMNALWIKLFLFSKKCGVRLQVSQQRLMIRFMNPVILGGFMVRDPGHEGSWHDPWSVMLAYM